MERNVPKLRFKGFNDEWNELKVSDTLKIRHGKDQKKIECENGEYPILATGGEIGRTDTPIYDKESVLIGRKGTIDRPIYMNTPFWTVDTLFYSEIHNNYIPKFIYYKFQCINWKKYCEASGVPSLSASTIESIKYKLPSLQEQERIANFLTKVDKIIEKQDEKVKNLEKYKKGMMQKIFSQEIRFKDENGKEYPEWEEKKLGEIAGVIMGQSPSSEAYNENYEGIPLIQGNADIKLRKTAPRIYTTEITKTCEIGDIIMSVRAPVGSIGIADHNCCIGRGVCAIKAKINNNYLYQVLLKKENKWSSISQGSTFESINKNDINGLKIVVPFLKEQEKIADFLTKIDLSSQKEYDKLKELKQWKRGLLQQMFV